MRSRLTLLLPFIALLVTSCWTPPKEVPYTADELALKQVAQKERLRRPFLWKLEKPGKPVSYAFGTMHVAVHVEELPISVIAKVHAARLAFFEIAPDESGDDGSAKVLRDFEPGAGFNLEDRLTEKEWDQLTAVVPLPSMLRTAHPWFTEMLYVYMLNRKDSQDLFTGEALDRGLIGAAQSRNVPLRSLDDLTKLNLSQIFPVEKSLKSLKKTLGKGQTQLVRDFRKETYKMIADYRTGNFAAIEKLVEGQSDDPQLNEAILAGRNRLWMKSLRPELEKGGLFIAVGVAHMPGPNGLLKSFEKAGFKVSSAGLM